ncbi:CRISPR-associated helicase/endonuclease Cas3 [Methylosarcina fibrata]|uniref:CRISPR-associated helicase/endonuclease Cas3 n=1 Tax=Methylosarcina fibrata TaxID=105972 RepID=UPI000372EE4F|nr:CRISPR-associated helicase/endonuclease Cas3 [Methylosarcina fibrata]
MDYRDFFNQATGRDAPYPYQDRLGNEPWPDFLEIPTGLGKTAAVTLAWLYKRIVLNDPETPRRLIYCLPMRVLVEQTVAEIRKWLEQLGGDAADIPVHLLMGGEDALEPWMLHPERNAIWIGTQDMLLSRALMRGYGMSRYQWPVHFALLHNEALWVFDEVQLMGAGLRTSAQLEAFRRQLQVPGSARTLWLSATLNKTWLKTVDFAGYLDSATTLNISDEDRRLAGTRLNALKTLQIGSARLDAESKKANAKTYLETLAQEIVAAHRAGTNTLAILNSVERAQDLTRLLQKRKLPAELLLVHARFRAAERKALNHAIQQAAPAAGRIIVATQAIEAGVDISSQTLFTELAPWSSLVQRFGRCNRYGEYAEAAIYWLDIADEASAPPYSYSEMEQARDTLRQRQTASLSRLPPVTSEQPLSHVLRRKDFLDLFNTDPDLTGFDIDVSLYIRDEGTPQLFVFWRDFDGDKPEEAQPDRAELCPASITQIKNHLKDKNKKAFVWDSLAGMWKPVSQNAVYPGQTLLLRAQDGGYNKTLGFVAADKQAVEVLRHKTANDQIYQKDPDSIKTIPILLEDHLSHVKKAAESLLSALGHLPDGIAEAIVVAALWHDVGKVHEVFQTTLKLNKDWPEGDPRRLQYWAKSPSRARHGRPYFRHELASMLAWLEHGEKTPMHDLIAYLIVAHHGKVRISLRAMPDEKAPNGKRYARGVHEGDELPALTFDGNTLPATRLRLDVMELGESEAMGPSWTNRTQRLLAEHGPFRLAWYETLVRIADWRASNQEQQ